MQGCVWVLRFRPVKLDSVLLGFSREHCVVSEPYSPPAMADVSTLIVSFDSTFFFVLRLTWFLQACCFNVFLVKFEQHQFGL